MSLRIILAAYFKEGFVKILSLRVLIVGVSFLVVLSALTIAPLNRAFARNLSAPNFLFSFSSFPTVANRGSVLVTVRDSITGERIAADLRSVAADGQVNGARADEAGRGTLSALGRTDVEVSADGYKSLKTYFIVDGNALNVTIYIDPIEVPVEMRSASAEAEILQGATLLHGHISDENGKPVVNARVYLAGGETEGFSDGNGYFKFLTPAAPVDPVGDLPGTAVLTVESDGQVIYQRPNTMIAEGAAHFIIDIKADGATVDDGTHKLRLSPEELKSTQNYEPPPDPEPIMPAQPGAITVPASIRVGSSCLNGRTSCTVFTVYTLDTYVRFGLDDEWIASWNANSLKAGAIAFRSYGVYHVFFPINAANYDICNTTSCQVCDPSDSFTATNNATIQTTGTIVVNAAGTGPFFSEYSAENNLGGCPDGFTGNNGTWPCLSDPVDAGQAFFGHGRGMCQWGSQRWSINQGKDFMWIANHYYNANGNPSGLRNGVLQVGADTIPPPPSLTEPGNTTAPGTIVTTLTPTFQWEPVERADGYSLYISKYNGSTYDVVFNSETALGQPITGTTFTLPAGILVANGEYRWNMSSHIGVGYGTPNTFRNYFVVNPIASVSGRVTSPNGIGIRNALVTIIDAQNVRRTATTSSFGLYSFANVAVGQSHTVSVTTKRYRFAPQVLTVNGSIANVDFIGQE